MSRRSSACLGVTALALAALFVAAEPASAQRWGRGWGGTGFYAGYGSPYYGGYGWGGSPWYYGDPSYYGWNSWRSFPAYSGAWDSGWSYPTTEWYTPGMEWSGTEYTTSAPSYYTEGTDEGKQGQYGGAMGGQGFGGQAYGMMSGGQMDNRVLIMMRVPPDAQVWFDDQKTAQTGLTRSYITPPLNPNRDFAYQVRVQWMQNGHPVDRVRKVDVHAGDRLFVNFMQPASQGMGGNRSGGQYGNTGPSRGNPGTAPMPRNNMKPEGAPNSRPNTNSQAAPNLGPNNATPTDNTNLPPTRPTNRAGTRPPATQPQSDTPPK